MNSIGGQGDNGNPTRGDAGSEGVTSSDVERARHLLQDWLSSDKPEVSGSYQTNAQESDWLKIVYGRLVADVQHDQERGWTVLQLFVPLSLSPFLAVVVLEDLDLIRIVVLSLASLLLLVFANLYYERLRTSLRKNWVWVHAIEAEVGFPYLASFERRDGSRHRDKISLTFSKLRWLFLAGVVVIWVTLGFLVLTGAL